MGFKSGQILRKKDHIIIDQNFKILSDSQKRTADFLRKYGMSYESISRVMNVDSKLIADYFKDKLL